MISDLPCDGHFWDSMEIWNETWEEEIIYAIINHNREDALKLIFSFFTTKSTPSHFITFGHASKLSETDLIYLISNGDVGALPPVLARSMHSVFTDGLVGDGDSLWQPAILQNDLRRQRLAIRKI